jgi:hypothetical protein
MFASNFGGPTTVAFPFPSASPVYAQGPTPAQTALLPSQSNDDPAHLHD